MAKEIGRNIESFLFNPPSSQFFQFLISTAGVEPDVRRIRSSAVITSINNMDNRSHFNLRKQTESLDFSDKVGGG
jgi:hypothetical protein